MSIVKNINLTLKLGLKKTMSINGNFSLHGADFCFGSALGQRSVILIFRSVFLIGNSEYSYKDGLENLSDY